MLTESLEHLKLTILQDLSETALQCQSGQDALVQIAMIGQAAMKSHVFALALIDYERNELRQVICKSDSPQLEEAFQAGSYNISLNNAPPWILAGKSIECYDLQRNAQDIIDVDLAQEHHLNAILIQPLRTDQALIGYLFHITTQTSPFDDDERCLLQLLAHQAAITMESCDRHYAFRRSLSIFSELSTAPGEFIEVLPQKACQLFNVPIAVLWKKADDCNTFRIVATAGDVDEEYRKTELKLSPEKVQQLLSGQDVLYWPDLRQDASQLIDSEAVQSKGWIALLSVPLKVLGTLIGILDIFTKNPRQFKPWEQELFKTFANHAAISFQKSALRQEAERNLQDREKLQKLTEIMLQMTGVTTEGELLQLLLEGALDLVGSAKVTISKLNYATGELNIVTSSQAPDQTPKVNLGKGITGIALAEEKTINVPDVLDKNSEWPAKHIRYWNDTRAEIAVPIFIDRVPVRIEKDVSPDGTKSIGVLNLESPATNTFLEEDQERLELIARYTAIRIAKLETDKKLNDLKPIEQALLNERNFNKIIQAVINGITGVLKFDFVNISLVNPERTRIKTEYLFGLPEDRTEKFKKLANHSLSPDDSTKIDIQADLVRSKEIEVPSSEDPRLDQEIFKEFEHQNFLRVFLPMIEPSRGMVIGTVEAAYDRRYRKYIYEQDVQILKNFVDYALHALEQRRSGFIDRITHEFRSPIVGIRSNADFLKRRIHELDREFRERKFLDVLTDCEILLYQVGELEYILGDRNSQRLKIRKTVVFRDIVIKTVNQLKPIVYEQGFKMSDVIYNPEDSRKIIVDTDPFKLNQVVYNLLINSIKYADKSPERFRIEIELNEGPDTFTIKFKDWGIGIGSEYIQDIFKEGFRCPEAWQMDVNGTGLGLTISKTIMKQLKGDLILRNHRNPTEFHLKIPKKFPQTNN